MFKGDRFVRHGPGRPKAEVTKEKISVRLGPDVLVRLRESGAGWQSRINQRWPADPARVAQPRRCATRGRRLCKRAGRSIGTTVWVRADHVSQSSTRSPRTRENSATL